MLSKAARPALRVGAAATTRYVVLSKPTSLFDPEIGVPAIEPSFLRNSSIPAVNDADCEVIGRLLAMLQPMPRSVKSKVA